MLFPAPRLSAWSVLGAAVWLAGCGSPPTARLRNMLDNTPTPVCAPQLNGLPAWQGGFSTLSSDPQAQPYGPQPLPNAYGYLQNGPVFAGAEIAGPPQTTATERALQLRQEIDQLTATRGQLQQQLVDLSIELTQKQQALAQAADHLQATQQDLATVRGELKNWNDDVRKLQASLRTSERNQLDALEDVVQLLSHVIDQQQTDPAAGAAQPPREPPSNELSPPAAASPAAGAAAPTPRPATNAVNWK